MIKFRCYVASPGLSLRAVKSEFEDETKSQSEFPFGPREIGPISSSGQGPSSLSALRIIGIISWEVAHRRASELGGPIKLSITILSNADIAQQPLTGGGGGSLTQ